MKMKEKERRNGRRRSKLGRRRTAPQREVLTYTGLPVPVQLVAVVTGAERAVGGVLAVMRATPVVLLTAVDDLHFNAWRREDQNHN